MEPNCLKPTFGNKDVYNVDDEPAFVGFGRFSHDGPSREDSSHCYERQLAPLDKYSTGFSRRERVGYECNTSTAKLQGLYESYFQPPSERRPDRFAPRAQCN